MTHQHTLESYLAVADVFQARDLPLARYRFTAQIHEDTWLPEYAGSLFRGQFGAALRRLSCMTRQPECTDCPLKLTCPYTLIFQPVPPTEHALQNFSAIPTGYIIVPPLPEAGYQQPYFGRQFLSANSIFEFEMVLVGDIRHQLPLIIYAWQRALARGLTRDRKQATLLTVQCLNSSHNYYLNQCEDSSFRQIIDKPMEKYRQSLDEFVWTIDSPNVHVHNTNLKTPTFVSSSNTLRISINTPLRLQRKGHIIGPENLDTRTLISAMARRIALIMEFHSKEPKWGLMVPQLVALSEAIQIRANLRWFDWRRYSSRQRQEMALGGVVGDIELTADREVLRALWPWLWVGQWVHIGKNATFGMGNYDLEWL